MDDSSRDDPVTAARPTRRAALARLAGAGAGALAWLTGAVDARAKPGDHKHRHRHRQRRRERRRKQRPPLYPDLQTLPPRDLRFDQLEDGAHVLRFTNTVWNAGEGRLEMEGNPDPASEGTKDLFQNIYDRPAGGHRVIHRRVDGEILYHPTHMHYHFADFASYQLLHQDEDGIYQPVGEGTKTSFCITDNTPVGAAAGRKYLTCQRELQGLSPGWGDTYTYDLPEQWVVLAEWPLPDGAYGLQSTADPKGLLAEGGGERETNNAAVTYFTVVAGAMVPDNLDPPSRTAGAARLPPAE
jgi:hypothetical protein